MCAESARRQRFLPRRQNTPRLRGRRREEGEQRQRVASFGIGAWKILVRQKGLGARRRRVRLQCTGDATFRQREITPFFPVRFRRLSPSDQDLSLQHQSLSPAHRTARAQSTAPVGAPRASPAVAGPPTSHGRWPHLRGHVGPRHARPDPLDGFGRSGDLIDRAALVEKLGDVHLFDLVLEAL